MTMLIWMCVESKCSHERLECTIVIKNIKLNVSHVSFSCHIYGLLVAILLVSSHNYKVQTCIKSIHVYTCLHPVALYNVYLFNIQYVCKLKYVAAHSSVNL